MDGRTDGPTDGRTDGPTKRVVESRSTRLIIVYFNKTGYMKIAGTVMQKSARDLNLQWKNGRTDQLTDLKTR